MALAEIVERKRVDVARRMKAAPLHTFDSSLEPSDRNLTRALGHGPTAFVMECKKASPSKGLIRPDFDPIAIARAYADVAQGISVLTDVPYFQGSLAYLRAVRDAVDVPVLCKDFVLSPYQVLEARHHGADAVLLMASVLSDGPLRECLDAARSLSLDALVEVHDEAELDRALAVGATLIGVNNRDLKTLQVDLSVSERLAPLVPDDAVLVCESGIRDHRDVRRLRSLVDAFLVGGSLMAQQNVGAAARRLAYGRVKVCGLTNPQDAHAAWRAGAEYGGLIFAEASPRCVTVGQASGVVRGAPLDWVGVFVDAPLEQVVTTVRALGLSAVQLHGEESPEYVRGLREQLRQLLPGGCEIWKAWRVRSRVPALAETGADRLLLDTWIADRAGGTGETFDWGLIADHPERERLVLAGGLAPENIDRAAALGVWALDVNSGVEDAPGQKSPMRLADLFATLRGDARSSLVDEGEDSP